MKFKNKIMTAIVSICMLAFILPMAVSAADNADSSDKNTITCYVRAEQDDGTILPYTKVTMNKDEVPSFQSYKIKNAPDDADYITPLHILLQALTDKGMTDELATVDIGSSGWITDMFGWGMDQLWCLNGIDAPTVSAKYKAKDGDKYTFYQAAGNWGAGYGYPGYGFFGEYGPGQDYTPYSAIETDDVTTEVGQDVELTYRYTSSMHTPQYGPCNNEDGAYTMIFVGKNGADKVTDEDYREDIEVDKDGKFKVSFDKPGTYVVSGRYYNNDNTRGACNAYCKVTVTMPEAVTAVIDKISAIGDVTLESEDAIKEARTAYDALTDAQKELVEGENADPDYFGRDTGDASKDDPRNQDDIGENELLVVSFGTSFNDSRVKDIKGIEDALQEANPDWSVRRAFTAQIIINHVEARDGESIDNMDQALERAVANNVKNLVVQPTHLMHGAEYDELTAAVEKYQDKFESVKIAEPLLGEVGDDASVVNDDKKAVAEAITAEAVKTANYDSLEAAKEDGTAFVFMGHGTSHTAKVSYSQMQAQMQELGYENVFIGTVEGEPEDTACEAVIEAVKNAGYKKVVLRPLMVVAGDHANNDMAGDDDDSWKSQFVASGNFDSVDCQIAGLGEIPAIQDIYVAHTAAAIE